MGTGTVWRTVLGKPHCTPPTSSVIILIPLSCCEARRYQLPSCSNPGFQQLCDVPNCAPDQTNFCPIPPKLTLEDLENPDGPLDNMNTFVAEYILRNSDASYFQNVLGGLTISRQEPVNSVCGCEQGRESENECQAFLTQSQLQNSLFEIDDSHPIPAVPLFCENNTILETSFDFQAASDVGSGTPLPPAPIQRPVPVPPKTLLSSSPACHSVNNITSFCVDSSCFMSGNCSARNQSLASQYTRPPGTGGAGLAITVWYNNQVSGPAILNYSAIS